MIDSGTTGTLRHLARWRAQGHKVVLASVVRSWGSAPRGPGALMAVCDNADFAGSVSGGCVEVAVIEEARGAMRMGRPRVVEYGVSDEDAWSVGLPCGGQIQVHLDPVGNGMLEESVVQELITAREGGEAVVLATVLSSGLATLWRPNEQTATRERNATAAAGHAAYDEPAREAAYRSILDDVTTVVELHGDEVLLRPHNPPVRVIVVGAVHLTQVLVPVIEAAGFAAVVVDPRQAFATPERFPGVRPVVAWPGEAMHLLRPDHRTAVVVVSHDAKLDDPALVSALSSPAFYVGALGSRRSHARRLERLKSEGVAAEALDRIHAPVGLDIGARTPGEIAVAVVAEIVAALRSATRR